MSVFGVWAGGETDGFVTCSELNVEPGDEGMDKIIALSAEAERSSKSEIGRGNSVEIEGQDWAWICYKCFHFDRINKRFCKRILLHRRKGETIDVVPD